MVYSRVNKNFNKRIHETLGVGYYNLLMKMRAPIGRPSRTSIIQQKKLTNMKNNYQKLKNYYYTIRMKTNYTTSHPTMKAFKNKLAEYAKYIKERERTLQNTKTRLNKKTVVKKKKEVKYRKPMPWR